MTMSNQNDQSEALPSRIFTEVDLHPTEGQSPYFGSNPSAIHSFCRHATSNGSKVFGFAHQRVIWETVLPSNVVYISSNRRGTVIVAATDAGTVSLLRGCDGRILATRQVFMPMSDNGQGESVATLPIITWIYNENDYEGDALLIESEQQEACCDSMHTSFTILSQILGETLNSEDTAKIASAANNIQIKTFVMRDINLRAIAGHFVSPETIRLMACTADGCLSVFDYSLVRNSSSPVKTNVAVKRNGQDYTVDFDLGLYPYSFGTDGTNKVFYLCAGLSDSDSLVFWIDAFTLQPACAFHLPSLPDSGIRLRVSSIEGLNPSSVAIAVSTNGDGDHFVHVIQVDVDETLGLLVLSKPYVLYTIPVQDASVDALELASTVESDYGCWIKLVSDQRTMYRLFSPARESTQQLRLVQSLLENENFDELEEAMGRLDESFLRFTSFGQSEVAIKRLQSLLRRGAGGDAEQYFAEIQECFDRLISYTHSKEESSSGIGSLLKAVDIAFVSKQTLDESKQLLSMLTKTFNLLLDSTDGQDPRLFEKKRELDERFVVSQFLGDIASKLGTDGLQFDVSLNAVKSVPDLFVFLIEHRQFSAAELVWRMAGSHRKALTSDLVIESIVKIPMTCHPREYTRLLESAVLPSMSIGEYSLETIRYWVCRTADRLDEADEASLGYDGLEAAIELLKVVDKGCNELLLGLHASFARSTPFVDRFENRSLAQRPLFRTSRFSKGLSDSIEAEVVASDTSSIRLSGSSRQVVSRSKPTIMELGLKGGATMSRSGAVRSKGVEFFDADVDCVGKKLKDALCLQRARKIGLCRSAVSLRAFNEQGGAEFVAKECVSMLTDSQLPDKDAFSVSVIALCADFQVDFDHVICSCAFEICQRKNLSEHDILEASSVLHYCSSHLSRAKAALGALRSALLIGFSPPSISKLAADAKEWAICDSSLQEELGEASRLHVVNSIVVKYCGREARSLFRVENPRHAVRLLDFIAEHIHEEDVLANLLDLCDAFTHLNSSDAACRLFQNSIEAGDISRCTDFATQLCARNVGLAVQVMAAVMSFSDSILSETSSLLRSVSNPRLVVPLQKKSKAAIDCALSMIDVLLDRARVLSSSEAAEAQCLLPGNSLESAAKLIARICRLQEEFSIFVSFSDLMSVETSFEVAYRCLKPVVDAFKHNAFDDCKTQVSVAKRAYSLLFGDSRERVQEIWCALCGKAAMFMMKECPDCSVVGFLRLVGIFDEASSAVTVTSLLYCSLYTEVANDGSFVSEGSQLLALASLVGDHALRTCRSADLPLVLSSNSFGELASEMLFRGDRGAGDAAFAIRSSLRESVRGKSLPAAHSQRPDCDGVNARKRRLVFHSSWYIGDGLLLPPEEATSYALEVQQVWLGDLSKGRLVIDFLRNHGAHFLALRFLCSACSYFTCARMSPKGVAMLASMCQISFEMLAERSLGGSSRIGFTSGIVDSQLAMSFLLDLPKKLAFSIYKQSLPTAIKSYDFARVFSLANVGLAACSHATVGWGEQSRFSDQCRNLSRRSAWWGTLKRCGVKFDPNSFSGDVSDIDSKESVYALTLLSPFIDGLSSSTNDSTFVWGVCERFSADFAVGTKDAVREFVAWLLLSRHGTSDVSCGPGSSDRSAKECLNKLETKARHEVMKEVLTRLECQTDSGFDYERYSVVLSLYNDTLLKHLNVECNLESQEVAQLEAELELVDRKRDALAILSSYYSNGSSEIDRPDFSKLFRSLKRENLPNCGVLGKTDNSQQCFDPLEALNHVLSASTDSSVVTSLAPMCLSLGLPQGYIHARSLMQRFLRTSSLRTTPPSFLNDVVPVIQRMRSSDDRAQLAEWCARHYVREDGDRLKCLELALEHATKASIEAEEINGHGSHLQDAIDRLRRITAHRESLNDILRVKSILSAANSSRQELLSHLLGRMVELVNGYAADHEQQGDPDAFVEVLLFNGSLLVANACLDKKSPLPLALYRQFCAKVQEAITAIAEQHSHVQPSLQCQRLARKWLFFGDEVESLPNESKQRPKATQLESSTDVLREDTVDFVMDLTDIRETENEWETGTGIHSYLHENVISEEEPSATRPTSTREKAELSCQRASLRIAFVLACFGQFDLGADSNDQENSDRAVNAHSRPTKSRQGLLAKIETKRDLRNERVVQQSRDLLRIVFAHSETSAVSVVRGGETSFSDGPRHGPKTVTFAMRHRALRAASILCPQEALERVADEEGYLRDESVKAECTLSACAYGVFVAKEIEEIGLPLPHSSLLQLSSMHFLSYARTLWRNHCNNCSQKGRLLLLLLEMSLKDGEIDPAFVQSVLEEMLRLKLPRSLLSACDLLHEATTESPDKARSLASSFCNAVSTLVDLVISDVKHVATSERLVDDDVEGLSSTLERLSAILVQPSVDVGDSLQKFLDFLSTGISVDVATRQKELDEMLRSCSSRLGNHL